MLFTGCSQVKRLSSLKSYTLKSKKVLAAQLVATEAALHRERRERAAMEEALSEAYSATLREVVALQEATGASCGAGGKAGRKLGGGKIIGRK